MLAVSGGEIARFIDGIRVQVDFSYGAHVNIYTVSMMAVDKVDSNKSILFGMNINRMGKK